MLNPDARSLYTSAMCPPPGYIFDQAIATTYSLDPATLLSLPTHLALAERPSTAPPDPIKLLESLRRLSGRFSIYVDQAGIKVPTSKNLLYGLLESMVIPVKAPRGGVFHPKIWALRFVHPDINEPPLIRLLILSRNITYDRSWDISLQLEGQPGRRVIVGNQQLVELVQALPSMSNRKVTESQKLQAVQIAEEIRKTDWELPEGFESVSFHVLGHKRRTWAPARSNRMALVSPFLTDSALAWLRGSTDEIVAVISRPDELDKLGPDTLCNIAWYTLDESAESEDGEETFERDTLGLHAKTYVLEKGWRTILLVGSANATGAAIIERKNIEVLAELIGKTSQVGGIDKLIGDSELGQFLLPYSREEGGGDEDDEVISAKKALEAAKALLAEAGLKVYCQPDGDSWRLSLATSKDIALPGISDVKAWAITVSDDRAVNIRGLAYSNAADLGIYATESVTGLIAFDLISVVRNLRSQMVLNLPIDGLPDNRDDAIFRLVVNNKEGFLRYLLLLLGEYGDLFYNPEKAWGGGDGAITYRKGFSDDIPILEELARAFSRNPEKLKDVRAVVNRFRKDKTAGTVIPEDFLKMWGIFEEAMKEVKG